MNDHQNSQFDKGYFDSQKGDGSSYGTGSTYEYVFSTGTQGNTPQRPRRGGGGRAAFLVLAVLLCAGFSFVAAFGGVYAANLALASRGEAINSAPKQDDLLRSDPESVLNKAESSESIYGSAGEDVFDVSGVVRKVEDAVVVIDVKVQSGSIFGGSQTTASAGSGVIISPDGYILTCHHVVENAISVIVTLNSGSRYEASLVGSDERSDLAVLRIEPRADEPLTYAEQGCSADLVVGEHVVAIGNPLGTLGGTVTDGIISATERNIQTTAGVEMTLLQTNAAINSGNSGGGLFNLDGKLIGIVNAKYAAQGVEGLAFAIPIDSAYAVELDLIEYGYVRGIVDHGLETLDITQSNYAQYHYYYNVNRTGVYVVSSEYNTDLKNKDCIISVNGTDISTTDELNGIVEKLKVGDTVTVVALRDGKEFTTTLTLREYVPDSYKELK